MNTKTHPIISFIILSYASEKSVLRNNLEVLDPYQVIIVDNTQDESKKVKRSLEKEKHSNTTILEQSHNTGYAEGMTIGMNNAWKQDSDWVVLLNDDVVLSKEMVNELQDILKKKQPGIYGPFVGTLDEKRWTTIVSNSHSSVQYISGSCMVIHKDVDESIKGFFYDYFMYYEDVEYCIRAQKAGFPVEYLPLSGIIHKSEKEKQKVNLERYYLARNHLVFVMRNAPVFIQLRELFRLPKTVFEERQSGGYYGVIDFILHRLGKSSHI